MTGFRRRKSKRISACFFHAGQADYEILLHIAIFPENGYLYMIKNDISRL